MGTFLSNYLYDKLSYFFSRNTTIDCEVGQFDVTIDDCIGKWYHFIRSRFESNRLTDHVLTRISCISHTRGYSYETINYHQVKANLNYTIEARVDDNVCKLDFDAANNYTLLTDEAW